MNPTNNDQQGAGAGMPADDGAAGAAPGGMPAAGGADPGMGAMSVDHTADQAGMGAGTPEPNAVSMGDETPAGPDAPASMTGPAPAAPAEPAEPAAPAAGVGAAAPADEESDADAPGAAPKV